ncbi:MAG TPA: DMT family transporter [Symbiobacteriaceae bacterium]|nr:DMT family transporter [Symbiobacteriaceae bacterium]
MDLPNRSAGLLYGFIGVAAFSLTLPATRAAVSAFSPITVTLGRALIAAALALLTLQLAGQRLPDRRLWARLAVTSACTVIIFPLLIAWAMSRVEANRGAVVLGLMPLATAFVGALRGRESPRALFWLAALTGSAIVVGFTLRDGIGQVKLADLALLAAVLAAGVGYAEGGRLARELGGWQVICWSLAVAVPLLAVAGLLALVRLRSAGAASLAEVPASAWLGLLYLGVVSQLAGFVPWYRGMVLGGVARVSQLQLLQPFLTIAASALLLGEAITLPAVAAATAVIITVAVGVWART